ncbi:MAG: hypothetical protein J7494_01905 [Sphingobium sp.]|nr:hypothetical protein [Sphingobium sp.]
MTDSPNPFIEAQQQFSDALFRFWLQPLQLTQAAIAAGSELIVKAGGEPAPAGPLKPEVAQAAEEQMGRLDNEIDRAVPTPAGIVA